MYKRQEANAQLVSDEETRAKAAEDANAKAIEDEETRAKAAEEANAQLVSDEETRAKAAEEANAQLVSDEETRAKAAEEANAQLVSDEETRAKGVEAANTEAIEDEATTARAAEQANQNRIYSLRMGSKELPFQKITFGWNLYITRGMMFKIMQLVKMTSFDDTEDQLKAAQKELTAANTKLQNIVKKTNPKLYEVTSEQQQHANQEVKNLEARIAAEKADAALEKAELAAKKAWRTLQWNRLPANRLAYNRALKSYARAEKMSDDKWDKVIGPNFKEEDAE